MPYDIPEPQAFITSPSCSRQSRTSLAGALRKLMETGVPLQGAADRLVSEAIYLADPDGNGIEFYRDRPCGEWSFDGEFETYRWPP